MAYLFVFLLTLQISLFAQENDNVFIGLNTGYQHNEKELSGDTSNLLFDIDESAPTYGAEVGYNLNKNIFFTLNYMRSAYEHHSFDNLYLSANYRFLLKESKFVPYIGALGGWSRLSWKDDPVISYDNSKHRSVNYLVGAQIGCEYEIDEHWNLYTSYSYFYSPQETKFENGKIEYSNFEQLLFGFRYSFSLNNLNRKQ